MSKFLFAMKHITSLTTLTLVAASGFAQAAAPQSSFTTTANVAIASDYVYRGVSQTDNSFAVQGGFDVSHTSGLSAGVWASSVDGPAVGTASSEVDAYAGLSLSLSKDITASLGYIQYLYEKNSSLNTGEVNVALSGYGLTAKASFAVSDYFGVADSEGTAYYDLSYTYAIEQLNKLALTLHYGLTDGHGAQVSYQHYSVGLALPLDSYTVGVTWPTCNNQGKTAFTDKLAGSTTSVSLKKTF